MKMNKSSDIRDLVDEEYSQVAQTLGSKKTARVSHDHSRIQIYMDQVYALLKGDHVFLTSGPNQEQMKVHLVKLCERKRVPQEFQSKIISEILDNIYNYGILTPLMHMPGVTTIKVKGDHSIRYRQFGVWHYFERHFPSNDEVYKFIEKKLKATPYKWSRMEASVDAILQDGSRLHVKGGTAGVTVNEGGAIRPHTCPIITIRRFLYPFSLDELQDKGVMDESIKQYLMLLPQVGDSLLIVGGQEVGKTTLLNALTEFIPKNLETVFIEEAPECQPKCEADRLWDRAHNGEGKGGITMVDNVKALLRMAADIGVVGEIRMPDVMYQFLNVTNLGLFFSAATLHASSAGGAIRRMISLGLSSRERPLEETLHLDIAEGVTHIVVLLRDGEKMGIIDISETTGVDEKGRVSLRKVFERDLNSGNVTYNGMSERLLKKLHNAGLNCPDLLAGSDVK